MNQMRNELLPEQQNKQQERDNFKKVRVQILGDIFSRKDCMDSPIFEKKDLQYDKYQLCKLITLQEFELLIRPFKKDPAFKKCTRFTKIFIAIIIIFMLAAFSTIPLSKMEDDNDIIFWIWAIVFCGSFLCFLITPLIMFKTYSDAQKALYSYCEKLDLGHSNLKISGVCKPIQRNIFKWFRRQVQAPGKYSCIFFSLAYFQIKSTTILQDQTSIKLYAKGSPIESCLSSSMQKPIFSAKSFTFDNEKLQNIISFENLQMLLRPFKTNEYYKKQKFLTKCLLSAILLILLIFLPLMIWQDIIKQAAFMVFLIAYLTLIYGFLIFLTCKLQKTRVKLIVQFSDYCKQVSIRQRGIEIIVHFDQQKNNTTRSGLYCLQIKKIGQ